MGTVCATIHPGVCGFVTRITATSDDEQLVRFDVDSPCENIQGLAARIMEVDAYAELGAGFKRGTPPGCAGLIEGLLQWLRGACRLLQSYASCGKCGLAP